MLKSVVNTLIFIFVIHISSAQNLFDIDSIRTIEINFYDSDWDHQLDSLSALSPGTGSGTERILADVLIDGILFDSCGVRYKGNSSLDTSKVKNPFNIDLNYVIPTQEYLGKDKIKLANCFTDPSMVREALMYELSNQYMDCPRASFVKLFVNGDYFGIYTNTESVDNEFLNKHYGSSNNPFFKCDPVTFQIYGDNSNLSYYADTVHYDTTYDMKSDYGLEELQTLCYNLEFNSSNIDQYLDVDRALWFLAMSNAFVHNDGYMAFAHNYYIYKMPNGRWSIILWDVNMSFGGLLWNGFNFFPLTLSDLQQQNPYLHDASINYRPLIARLLSQTRYRKMYSAHFRTIIEENISNGKYLQRAEYMSNLIDSDVQNELYNPYSYQDFTDNLYTDVGVWFDLRPGLENLMEGREVYFDTLSALQLIQPDILNVTPSDTAPLTNSVVTITAEVINGDSVFLGFRNNHFDVFTRIPMFDDGFHNDGNAGDGIYGADIPVQTNTVEYYVYAENTNAAKFAPARAEYEFYNLTPQKDLVINELAASNATIAYDEAFEYDDWIELYNNSTNTISLDGYYLSDDASNLLKWPFPNVSIAPGQYLIVWADNDVLQSNLHANFRLSASGEGLFLTDDSGLLIDEIVFPAQTTDITFGRYPNGTGNFNFLYPTFNAENTTPLAIQTLTPQSFKVYPNPTNNFVVVEFANQETTGIQLFDLSGKQVLSHQIKNEPTVRINVNGLNPGLYLIKTDSGAVQRVIITN